MLKHQWIAWPDATAGQAWRNRAVIRATCTACGWETVPVFARELAQRFGADRLVASIKGHCRHCGARRQPLGAFFPEGWVEDISDWPRRREEGL